MKCILYLWVISNNSALLNPCGPASLRLLLIPNIAVTGCGMGW